MWYVPVHAVGSRAGGGGGAAATDDDGGSQGTSGHQRIAAAEIGVTFSLSLVIKKVTFAQVTRLRRMDEVTMGKAETRGRGLLPTWIRWLALVDFALELGQKKSLWPPEQI